jgi:hypothetical protein
MSPDGEDNRARAIVLAMTDGFFAAATIEEVKAFRTILDKGSSICESEGCAVCIRPRDRAARARIAAVATEPEQSEQQAEQPEPQQGAPAEPDDAGLKRLLARAERRRTGPLRSS